MRHVLQPVGSSVCTQCSVAMVTGAELDEVFEVFGHRGSSNLPEAWAALQALGIARNRWKQKVDNRKRLDLSGKGLIRLHVKGRKMGHMLAFENGRIYDPEGFVFDSAEELRNDYYKTFNMRWVVDFVLYVY